MKWFNDTVPFLAAVPAAHVPPTLDRPGAPPSRRCVMGRSPALLQPFSLDPSQQEGAESPISDPLLHINSNITFKLKISFFPAWCASK